MTDIRVNGIPHAPVSTTSTSLITPERLRTIVQDAHLNFLIGAGTPTDYFGILGNIEDALTELASSPATDETKAMVRASIQAYFFDEVLAPNLQVIDRAAASEKALTSYARFLRTLNRTSSRSSRFERPRPGGRLWTSLLRVTAALSVAGGDR